MSWTGTDRSVVEVEMRLFDTLTMIALRVGQAKEPLLQEVADIS